MKPYRVLTFSSVAALVLASLGAALLPYVIIGMFGWLLSFVALVLAFRVALSALPSGEPERESGDNDTSAILLIVGGVLLMAAANGSLGLAVPHILRPENFRGDPPSIVVWGVLALVGPFMVTAGVRRAAKLNDSRMLAVWAYWFSYAPAVITTSLLIALRGWGGRT
ncbi:hypothetical protein FIV42_01060 [Persicimonas caeni]|uniref:Uncharacterized protein n=1 Tax=Persicimonas caeni TaxID=2292766 RepID=A0A4Y6PM76_PERCE|nr:hypothetical protein [Persicimonas caeni]QDG49372.1 hypothetical protein FIV42_01060 [Persicimonas caeni]QED30593.1 hypothetical protein FRD00_01055 [Persicimonas caeni]